MNPMWRSYFLSNRPVAHCNLVQSSSCSVNRILNVYNFGPGCFRLGYLSNELFVEMGCAVGDVVYELFLVLGGAVVM